MNTLLQDKSLLIGSPGEIEMLASKESARILAVSDSHGAYASFFLILKQFGKHSDILIFCGDGICDVSRLIENAVDTPEIQEYIPPVIGIVEGNNDADLYPVRNVLSDDPYYVELRVPVFNIAEVCGHRVFFTHGHRNSLYMGNEGLVSAARDNDCEIALYGHTHIAEENLGQVFALNPGSCYRPRGGQKPSFAVIDLKKNSRNFESTFYELSFSGSKPFIPFRTF